MWKPLALVATLAPFAIPAAQAEGIYINSDETGCNADLNYTLRVGPDAFEAREEGSEDEQPLMRYRAPADLVIDGETVSLDEQQQQLLQEYRKQLHLTGRETLLISLEAVDLALSGMSVALTVLAGPEHPDNLELQRTSEEILRQTEERLNREGEIYTLGDPELEDSIDRAIEEEFEPKIEKLATEYAGTIAWNALKAVFTGGASIERDVEQLAETMEEKLEKRAELLENRVDLLCEQIRSAERLENELQKSIPAMAGYDFIEIE